MEQVFEKDQEVVEKEKMTKIKKWKSYHFDIRDDVMQDMLQYCLWASGAKPLTARIFNGKPVLEYDIVKGDKDVDTFVKLMIRHGYYPKLQTFEVRKGHICLIRERTITK